MIHFEQNEVIQEPKNQIKIKLPKSRVTQGKRA
jgi:hypothetical protein